MGLNKATGDMYGWVTHTHTHLRGQCPHKCEYCYAVKGRAQRFYQGPLRLEAKELQVGYGSRDGVPKTIFIEHMSDLFAMGVLLDWRRAILDHCRGTPENTYVFQTKNPFHALGMMQYFPSLFMLGTTIETDRAVPCSAPTTRERAAAMSCIRASYPKAVLFVTVEPVMDFDPDVMLEWMKEIRPDFVNIGADSKGCGLREPGAEQIWGFSKGLLDLGIKVNLKPNLKRIFTAEGKALLLKGVSELMSSNTSREAR